MCPNWEQFESNLNQNDGKGVIVKLIFKVKVQVGVIKHKCNFLPMSKCELILGVNNQIKILFRARLLWLMPGTLALVQNQKQAELQKWNSFLNL